jgi:hypothetical protein
MMTYQYQLTCISESEQNRVSLSDLEEAAELCDLHPEMIEEFLRGRLVHAFKNKQGDIYFDSSGVSRLRHIAYLREHEQIKFRTIRYITSLLDSLEAREKELYELRERLR